MSDIINTLKKRIYENQPFEGSNGQYNYGKVDDEENVSILGKEKNSVVNEDSDLYTYVINKQDTNLTLNPTGLLWQTFGSKIQVTSCIIYDNRYYSNLVDSAGGNYRNVQVAFYIFDSATAVGKTIEDVFNGADINQTLVNRRTRGNKIRDAIGEGNGFGKSPYCIGYKNIGDKPQKTWLGDVISEYSEAFEDVSIKDFPRKVNSTATTFKNDLIGLSSNEHQFLCTDCEGIDNYNPNNEDEEDTKVFNITKFYNQIIGKEEDVPAYYIVVRTAGDEREKVAGFSGKDDELDRNYTVIKIPKIELFQLWSGVDGEIELTYDAFSGDSNPLSNDQPLFKIFEDDYGDTQGYRNVGDNKIDPLYSVDAITIKITAPTAPTPVMALKSIEEGGINANWVNPSDFGWWCANLAKSAPEEFEGQRQGLNPIYDIDFLGFPSNFYYPTDSDEYGLPEKINGNRNYFLGSLITQNDFRPISWISSSFDIDCQSYYSDERESGFQLNNNISAPDTFKLGFKLSEKSGNIESSLLTYFPPDNTPFQYHFFVVNWDWKDGDSGGGECEKQSTCIQEIGESFPSNLDELGVLNGFPHDLYKLKTIGEIELDNSGDPILDGYGERPDLASHQYMETGIKIIKAVVFSTITSTSDYNGYIQAIKWKLVTIKINITEDRGIVSDFSDVGGDDFVYLPYPDVANLDTLDISGNSVVGESTGRSYKSSHVVISGLSEESIYVNDLKKILKIDNFGKAEITEKIEAKKSFENSPKGKLNEYGDFLGKSNISQIRYFNTAHDMKTLLNIPQIVINDNYHPHSDIDYWSGEINSFPKESPVGDIFISEYDQFRESCLFELNLNELDGKTIKDTSGNGNKGILIGDYSVKKDKINKKSKRDSYIKTSKIKKKNGAF